MTTTEQDQGLARAERFARHTLANQAEQDYALAYIAWLRDRRGYFKPDRTKLPIQTRAALRDTIESIRARVNSESAQ